MRPLITASTLLLALAAAPAMAKPTTAETAWNLRGALTPRVDLNVVPRSPERALLVVQSGHSPAPLQGVSDDGKTAPASATSPAGARR